jgi:hypothetical protein
VRSRRETIETPSEMDAGAISGACRWLTED